MQRKYREGTYAARVRFTDGPVSGSDGDQIVQTFYLISPLKAPLDPDYSEIDIEYLPNGGWGSDNRVHLSSWETFSPEPNWQMDNASDTVSGSFDGWHTLVVQVADQKVKYYIDDVLRASQGGKYYPEVPMSINFNLWFIRDGLIHSRRNSRIRRRHRLGLFRGRTNPQPAADRRRKSSGCANLP